MTARPRRSFDATWLPFGMMIGFILGMGFALTVSSNLLLDAGVGFLVGGVLGAALGFRRRRGMGVADEDAADDLYRAAHGDPAPRRDDGAAPHVDGDHAPRREDDGG